MQDTGSWVSCLSQCSAPRCSENHVKVPDQIVVHLLAGFFFLSFFLLLGPRGDCILAWSRRAHNTCLFFLFCLFEQGDLDLKNIFKT